MFTRIKDSRFHILQRQLSRREQRLPAKRSSTETIGKILCITSFPPRECGIATFSQDLLKTLTDKFDQSFAFEICALESNNEKHNYTEDVKYTLNTDEPHEFSTLAEKINEDDDIKIILIQHEFGFFKHAENSFIEFIDALNKPVILAFHTVLPRPNEILKKNVQHLSIAATSIIAMTHFSETVLINDYHVQPEKIVVIPLFGLLPFFTMDSGSI